MRHLWAISAVCLHVQLVLDLVQFRKQRIHSPVEVLALDVLTSDKYLNRLYLVGKSFIR